jgi:hypothetical protein
VLLLGDLNVDFQTANMTSAREASIEGLVVNLGVEDMLSHIKQTKQHKSIDTWRMTRRDHTINSRCNYIMAEFMAVKITCPRLFDLDHHAVVAVLTAKSQNDNKLCKKQHTSFLLQVQ